jgi:hypothetical protein
MALVGTKLQMANLVECTGSRVLHSQGAFNAASTTWTFATYHCHALAGVRLRCQDRGKSVTQNIADGFE